ncbi:MAG: cytochrome c biogenesis protein CcsA, partial [Verrucomicrobiota bacterium]
VADMQTSQKKMWGDLAALPSDADDDARSAAIQPAVDEFKSFVDYQYEEAETRKVAKLAEIDNEIEAAEEPLENQRLNDKRDLVKVEGGTAIKEVKLYSGGYFKKSLAYFIFGFVILAFSWLAPNSKIGRILTWIATVLLVYGLVLNIYGITMRSIIRARPPITNLYDTVIFITGIAVLLALALEFFTRKGIGLLMAALTGVGGMFLSLRYEVKEATDTMDPLQAVLDTNFWLATHVTTINIGYAAGLLSAFLGAYYLLKRFLNPLPKVLKSVSGGEPVKSAELFDEPKEKRDLYKTVTNMNYGIVCFCLFFSLVGTVLGGVWANYSWGRFWGWDPKENGALMICLWTLVILHMRMGGYVRDIGIAVLSILLGVIVTFSWWGVNNLGVGLHSYGFTEGVWPALYVSWAECAFIMACGIPLWWYERVKKRAKKMKRSADKDAAAAAIESGATPEGA